MRKEPSKPFPFVLCPVGLITSEEKVIFTPSRRDMFQQKLVAIKSTEDSTLKQIERFSVKKQKKMRHFSNGAITNSNYFMLGFQLPYQKKKTLGFKFLKQLRNYTVELSEEIVCGCQ